MKFNPHEIIPVAYFGREQAYIKHLLLDGYLERLLYIVGWNASQLGHSEIIFVDCFAGPWKDDSSDLSSTSIAISLNLLSNVRRALVAAGRPVKFKAIYVEKNAKAFARLERFLASSSPENVPTEAIQGDFTEKIPEILVRCSSTSFVFFFVDPKGWLTVKPEVLQSLLERPRSEFLINFMYDFVNRAVSMDAQREAISALFDQKVEFDELPNEPGQREQHLLELYRTAIVARANAANTLSAYVTILDPTIDRTKYHLIYLTRHSKGILEFMKQSEKLGGIQDAVRTAAKFNKKTKECNTNDLFGVDATQVGTFGESANTRIGRLETLWLARFDGQYLIVSEAIFARLLCDSNCFPSELQQALRNLIKQGIVKNLDGDISRRPKNAVNYEKKERLMRTDC